MGDYTIHVLKIETTRLDDDIKESVEEDNMNVLNSTDFKVDRKCLKSCFSMTSLK